VFTTANRLGRVDLGKGEKMSTATPIITLITGLAALLFGRQLFWLFVAIVGFIVSFNLAREFLVDQPDWMILLIALVIGLLGALLAVALQYVAAAIAGFLAGGYALFSLLNILEINIGQEWLSWVVFILGGIIGALLVLLLFDWALIILSAGLGATTLVQLLGQFTDLSSLLRLLAFLILLVVGIAFQAYLLPSDEPPRRRITVIRRVSHE
jgi:hypothetical protein